MSFLKNNYIKFMVWFGAAPPVGYEYLVNAEKKPINNAKNQDNSMDPLPEKYSETVRELFSNSLFQLLKDIIPPIRVLIATFIVFLAYFLASEILFFIFKWWTQNIQDRDPFFAMLFQTIEMLSATTMSIYFLISGISSLRLQWEYSNQMERKSGLK